MFKFATRNSEIGIRKQHENTYTSLGPGNPSNIYTSVGPGNQSSTYTNVGPRVPSNTYTSVGPQVLATPTLMWAKFGAVSILMIP